MSYLSARVKSHFAIIIDPLNLCCVTLNYALSSVMSIRFLERHLWISILVTSSICLLDRHLRFLNLNNTGLATWDEVDRLAKFPALKSLRVQVGDNHTCQHHTCCPFDDFAVVDAAIEQCLTIWMDIPVAEESR